MPVPIPVIDCWSPIVPSREIMQHVAHNFPEPMLGYLRVFGKRALSLDQYRDVALGMALDDAAILALLDAAGIHQTLVTGFDEASSAGGRTFVATSPSRHSSRATPGASSPSAAPTSSGARRPFETSRAGSGIAAFAD